MVVDYVKLMTEKSFNFTLQVSCAILGMTLTRQTLLILSYQAAVRVINERMKNE